MSYFGSIINNSATIIAKASAKITDGAFLAATLTENGVAVAKASETPIGIMVAETGTVEAGEEVTIQVKDIGLAKVGAAVNAGDILAADANGKLIISYRNALIYEATVKEDRERLWDNHEAWRRLDVINGVELIGRVLKAGEKDAILEYIDKISGYSMMAEDTTKN